MDDPHGVDERHLARYLASAGADYWLDSYVGAYARHRPRRRHRQGALPHPDWLTLTMSTLSLRKLETNPPPICVRGR